MMNFTLYADSGLSRDRLYAVSTDIENFAKIMPKHFESITVTESAGDQVVADERIRFWGGSLSVRTRHVIAPPDMHEVHIVSGMMRGSSFVETYEAMPAGTRVRIDVSLNFNGISKILFPLGVFIKRGMKKTMNEFLSAAGEA